MKIQVTPDPDNTHQSEWVAVNYTPGCNSTPSESDHLKMTVPTLTLTKSNKSNHQRKSTPAKIPSVKGIKKVKLPKEEMLIKESASSSADSEEESMSSHHGQRQATPRRAQKTKSTGDILKERSKQKYKMKRSDSNNSSKRITKKIKNEHEYNLTPNGSSSENEEDAFDAIEDAEMYENEPQNDINRLSIVIDDKIKSNKYIARKRAATEFAQKTKNKKRSSKRRGSFQQSPKVNQLLSPKSKLSPQLRSKSAVVWADEESEDELSEESEKQLHTFFNKLDKEAQKTQQSSSDFSPLQTHHQHRSSAEKIEIWKQKLFSPKNIIQSEQHLLNENEDAKFAFHKGADAVKTVTNLMINQSMANNKGKRKKKGRNNFLV